MCDGNTVPSFTQVRTQSRMLSGTKNLLPLCRRIHNILPLLIDLGLVLFLFALDMRDLYYKIAWIGPYNSFSFYAITSRVMDSDNLLSPTSAFQSVAQSDDEDTSSWATSKGIDRIDDTVSIASPPRESGWLPLISKCANAYTAGTSMVFVGVMGTNCSVGSSANSTIVPQFYMGGSVRPDSMAWAACKLLYAHRKPPICSANIVAGFLQRYGFDDRAVTREMLARPYTSAETELLELLLVISKSFPLYQTTCVEGFAYSGQGMYRTTLYGCGSPNVLESAVVGVHATSFAYLHQDKAWLTADTINIMGLKYTMRQNCISEFTVSFSATTGKLLLTPKTITNFSSSGVLYSAAIVIDVTLMLVHLWSAIEIARLVLIPLVRRHLKAKRENEVVGIEEDYHTVFTCSLYRSRPIVIMTLITQLISWIIILPNSIIWTWNTSSSTAKLQAYLSSLRLWVLILVVVNDLWDVVVVVNEAFAYFIAKKTYISSLEIIAVGAIISYVQRKDLFAVTDIKYAMEKQRNKDLTTYNNKIAFTNAFNEQIDYYLYTPYDVLWVVYKPLFSILAWSLVCITHVLVLRFVLHKLYAIATQRWRQRQSKIAAARAVDASKPHASIVTAIISRQPQSDYQPPVPAPLPPVTHYTYHRLPLEDLLNVPIRARCLVRSGMEIESESVNADTNERERFIRPPYFLEHGVVIDRGTMRSRRGFFRFLQPKVDFRQHVVPAESNAFQIMQLKRQLKEGKNKLFDSVSGVIWKAKGT
uniref:Uncharacterized protein n=1 Tax=Globisporangium ultimum (strain ATCC 200006 / CBS 805.95 / DAOM BR144) TaxID=431595 RepID=K3XBW0_GLOUD